MSIFPESVYSQTDESYNFEVEHHKYDEGMDIDPNTCNPPDMSYQFAD